MERSCSPRRQVELSSRRARVAEMVAALFKAGGGAACYAALGPRKGRGESACRRGAARGGGPEQLGGRAVRGRPQGAEVAQLLRHQTRRLKRLRGVHSVDLRGSGQGQGRAAASHIVPDGMDSSPIAGIIAGAGPTRWVE